VRNWCAPRSRIARRSSFVLGLTVSTRSCGTRARDVNSPGRATGVRSHGWLHSVEPPRVSGGSGQAGRGADLERAGYRVGHYPVVGEPDLGVDLVAIGQAGPVAIRRGVVWRLGHGERNVRVVTTLVMSPPRPPSVVRDSWMRTEEKVPTGDLSAPTDLL
jgi:hypothetical protein